MTSILGAFRTNGSGCVVGIMEKLYNYVQSAIVNCKLDYCCWWAPVRVGIYIIAVLKIIVDYIAIVGIANESISPSITKVQEILVEDYVSKPIPLLAYSSEMCFTTILLCGIYKNDRSLLKLYMHYLVAAVIMSVLVYSIVIAALDTLVVAIIIIEILLDIYMLVLVWSLNVELRNASQKNGDVKVVYDAADQEIKEMTTKPDVETPKEPDEAPPVEEKKEHHITTLETVDEEPKEAETNH